MNTHKLIIIAVSLFFPTFSALAWDPLGDITHPERIVNNVARETGNAVQDIPNVPRNVARETGNAIQDIPNIPRNVGRELDNAGREIDRMRLEAQAQAGAPILENWLRASRNTAIGQSSPIPPEIRYQLEGTYDADILNRVRYKIGDSGAFNIGGLTIQYADSVNAITLIDVIIFRNFALANDPALWAHELKHVQQYRDWGVRNFAIRYIRSWNGVEDPAYAAQNSFQYRQVVQGPPPMSPLAPPRGAFGQRCATQFGVCFMNQAGQVGQGCFCPGPPPGQGMVVQ